MTSIGKENRSSNAYLIKNSKGEGEGRWGGGGGGGGGGTKNKRGWGGGGGVGRQSEGLGGVVWVHKIGLK